MAFNTSYTVDFFKERGKGKFTGFLKFDVVEVKENFIAIEAELEPHLLAPNGYLHAGFVVTLADTAAGYGCLAHLPEDAKSFTTVELKTNFLSTATSGKIRAEGTPTHAGKTTQLWDVKVLHTETNKTMALFRCTQLVLY